MTSEEVAAGEALRAAKNWRSLTRAMRHGSWFPLVLFGLLTLAAAPLFWTTIPRCPIGETACSFVQNRGPLGNPFVHGPVGSGIGRWISVYWVVAVPLGYLATVLYYRHRARRTGVAGRIWPAVIGGLALLALMVGSFATRGIVPGVFVPVFLLEGRGLEPLLVIGIGLGILARLEHNRGLVVFALLFLALAVLANLYNMENEVYRLGWNLPVGAGNLPNLVVPGLFLLVGGAGFWWADRRVLRGSGGNS
jgi:hypothetical protein